MKNFHYLFISAFASLTIIALATLYIGCESPVRVRLSHDLIEFVSEGCAKS